MFDYVGHDPDTEARRRQATSFAVTTAGLTAITGFLVGLIAWGTATVVTAPAPEALLVEVILDDPELGPPPAAPAPRSASAPSPATAIVVPDSDPVDPDRVSDDPAPPPLGPQGTGPPGPPSTGTGTNDGLPGGLGTGQGPPSRTFHHSQLEERHRVLPAYPIAAEAMNYGTQRCVVDVWIDDTGVPVHAEATGCPEVFQSAATEAVLQWRWFPARDRRQRVPARTRIGMTFEPD